MVIGSTPPATFTGIAENCAPPERSTSIREAFNGDWSTDELFANVLGGHMIHQPKERVLVVFSDHDLPERPRVAEPRQPEIELQKILQRDTAPAETHRKARRFVLRQHQISPCLFQ